MNKNKMIKSGCLVFYFHLQELHAHLNGSLSSKTLQTLRKFKYGKDAENMDEYRLINEFSLNEYVVTFLC